jgi:hypothetical protein
VNQRVWPSAKKRKNIFFKWQIFFLSGATFFSVAPAAWPSIYQQPDSKLQQIEINN